MGKTKEMKETAGRNSSTSSTREHRPSSTSSSEDNKLAEMRMRENLDQFDAYIRGSVTRPEDIKGFGEIESDKLVEAVREKGPKSDGEEDTLANGPEEQEAKPVVVMRRKKKETPLPPGWEKHEDAEGAYFWHIQSGTIQRERPTAEDSKATSSNAAEVVRNVRSSRIFDDDFDVFDYSSVSSPPKGSALQALPKSCTSGSIADIGTKEKVVRRKKPEASSASSSSGSKDWKRRSMPTPTEAIMEENSVASSTNTSSSSAVHSTMQVNLRLRRTFRLQYGLLVQQRLSLL